jgi:hypothetical protein
MSEHARVMMPPRTCVLVADQPDFTPHCAPCVVVSLRPKALHEGEQRLEGRFDQALRVSTR